MPTLPFGQRLQPLLAGVRRHDRLVSAVGGAFGIVTTASVATLYAPAPLTLFLAAPIGASTVLMFVVPASPLAQPWPVIGGSIVSTLSGIVLLHLLGPTPLAAGLAVGLAILAMAALRCLHPPGGGYALLPVIAGSAALSADWSFALVPVAVNAVVLTLCGIFFHRLSGHSYPHRVAEAPDDAAESLLLPEDVDFALAEMGETFDVAREDLDALVASASAHARARLATRPRRR